jgi:hypothetical protein
VVEGTGLEIVRPGRARVGRRDTRCDLLGEFGKTASRSSDVSLPLPTSHFALGTGLGTQIVLNGTVVKSGIP